MATKISSSLNENIKNFNSILFIDQNFDLIYRTVSIGGRESCLYFIDGFLKDDTMEKLLQVFTGVSKEDMPKDEHEFSKRYIPYGEVNPVDDTDQLITSILSGIACLFIDGYKKAFLIDCRTYPMRSVDEPDKDKVLRGSRDGFVETLVNNTALIRRRIRSPKLTMEMLMAGETSKTNIVLAYMQDRVDQKFLKELRDKINNIEVDSLTDRKSVV